MRSRASRCTWTRRASTATPATTARSKKHAPSACRRRRRRYSRQQEKIAHLTRFIERFKAKATKARQAQSRVKALDRMERLAPVLTASDFQFEFREPASLPNPMLNLRDVACGYGSRRPSFCARSRRSVMAGQRIGVLGANGQGKSTLVKTITGALQPLSGSMSVGKGLVIGYFAQQEMDLLNEDDTPLQMMTRLSRTLGAPRRANKTCAISSASFRFQARWCTSASARCRAANARGWCWPRSCGSGPTCCCSTSRPTTSISPRARRCRWRSTSSKAA